jgi:DNA polymerase III subunit delta'
MPFSDVRGHRRVLDLIAGAALRESLPPSLIFAGLEGVGKRLAALALAQFLNCPNVSAKPVPDEDVIDDLFGPRTSLPRAEPTDASPPAATDACGTCGSCTRIARGVHADILLIEPGETGAIKVDQVREAIDKSAYRPFEGRRRVVIVDDADALLPEAQNALLKTLEEPPAASSFVLVTSRPDLLLPTVQSRCQRLRFGGLTPDEIADVLIQRHGYNVSDARAAASVADGSVGAALDEASEEFADAREAATRLLQGVAASFDPRRRLDGAKVLLGTRAGPDRDELARRLRALSSLLRDVGVLLSRADERCLANADLKPLLRGLVTAFDADRVVGAFSAVDRALEALERNASPKIVADWLAFQI